MYMCETHFTQVSWVIAELLPMDFAKHLVKMCVRQRLRQIQSDSMGTWHPC